MIFVGGCVSVGRGGGGVGSGTISTGAESVGDLGAANGSAGPCSFAGGGLSDHGGVSRGAAARGGTPSVSVGLMVEGSCSRAVRFSARRRWRIVEKTRWCNAWLSRKRTSALVGWTLTST